ncbi:hypothetical protein PRUB_a2427 [Pseudoalteromonas rubra]|uniref:Uncharacterized protein n=1 Tax=Pseudoalteromonas rubra TaxID=43658 RepID=A0A8T0CD22_9GAMM|nr:hypothetical protein PRUB_a2427 [Pseudoalteromonas rubra]
MPSDNGGVNGWQASDVGLNLQHALVIIESVSCCVELRGVH